jgi:uncharacterized protein (DUF2141 family)
MNTMLIAVALLAQVEGRVVNSLNSEPVPKTTVILRAQDEERGQSYADETGADGRFSINEVAPGEYAVLAERDGFVETGASGAPPPSITVEKGQQAKAITIRLMPLGAITGRVLDTEGDPVRGAKVSARHYEYAGGKRRLRTVAEVESGDNGDFRLFGLRAGTFYIRVMASDAKTTTYYPAARDESHASPIELHAGAQVRGMDIRLQSASVHALRFEIPDGQTEFRHCSCSAFLLNGQGFAPGQQASYPATGILFEKVPPGSYDVFVVRVVSGKPTYATQSVDVANADVDGGALTFLPAAELSGRVRVADGALSSLGKVSVHLHPARPIPEVSSFDAEVKPDGSFLITNVAPVVYEVEIGRIPGVYLKSAPRIDGAAKLEPLTLVLGTDVGAVEGVVHNGNGEALARARVDLIASRVDLDRSGFTGDDGKFEIKDVPPGEYQVFAWQDVTDGAPEDPDFRKPFENQAISLKMQPNGHEKLQLTAISPDQADRSSQ